MNMLLKRYSTELEQDCSDMLYALVGKVMHKILETDNKNYISEKRLYCIVDNYIISGQLDLYDIREKTIYDYKLCSTWEYTYGIKQDKIDQLNMYKYLAEQNGIEVEKMKLVFFFRDWSQSKAEYDKEYPQHPIMTFMVNKFDALPVIRQKIQNNLSPAQCTSSEKWKHGEKFAAMKKGHKRATKLFDKKEEAEKFMQLKKCDYIDYRPGENKRCKHYCLVSKFCKYKDK